MNTFYIWRICISSWWSGWSSKLFGLLIYQRRGDRAVDSGGFCLSPVIRVIFLSKSASRYFMLFTNGTFRLFSARTESGGIVQLEKLIAKVLFSLIFLYS
jgi:hypothetical protein